MLKSYGIREVNIKSWKTTSFKFRVSNRAFKELNEKVIWQKLNLKNYMSKKV